MNRKGFTLIELLIAIAITGFVTAAGFTFFNNTFNFSVLHKRKIDMQRETRIAIDILSRDIRIAGLGLIDPLVGSLQSAVAMVQPGNNVDPDSSGTANKLDRITIIGGYQGVGTLSAIATRGSTAISINFFAGVSPTYLVGKTISIEGFYYGTVTSRVGATNTFNISPGLPITRDYSTLNTVVVIQRVTYRVAVPAGETEPALYREVDLNNDGVADQSDIVASGIEDFQVAYLLTDGTEVYSPPAIALPRTGAQISAIRVSLLVRGKDPKTAARPSTRPVLEDHAAGTTADQYHRKVMTKVVEVRNLGFFK
jgi:prepilin-type N-terminal cleavage/methylation domain-containing protein